MKMENKNKNFLLMRILLMQITKLHLKITKKKLKIPLLSAQLRLTNPKLRFRMLDIFRMNRQTQNISIHRFQFHQRHLEKKFTTRGGKNFAVRKPFFSRARRFN